MICHTCGREIDDDSIFCTFCGADQRGADQDAAREGDTAAFPLSKALIRHGDRFEIRISKPFWVGLLGFLNAALIFPCVMLISMVLQIFSADPEERAFAADISWSFIPLIFLLLWMLLPMVRMLRQAIRLPAEGGKIRFAATEIESIVVNRIW
ncbi:MAG TPA: zinc ribbon domain-containing protein, partial [Acidobacteria bacterium]|nr:zinc ribbon domain-containing protein [Acidobacteriota bacterium]